MTNRSTSLALATVLSLCAAAPAVAQRLGNGVGETVKSVGAGAAELGSTASNGVGSTVRDLARDKGGVGPEGTAPYLPAGLRRLMEADGPVATIRPLGQERVLEAVRTRRALPLAQLLERAGMAGDGRLIDARLVQAGSFLLYEIKLIAPSGDVRQRYYYARSGLPVE